MCDNETTNDSQLNAITFLKYFLKAQMTSPYYTNCCRKLQTTKLLEFTAITVVLFHDQNGSRTSYNSALSLLYKKKL